jgi:PAS domain S-box-containing protein
VGRLATEAVAELFDGATAAIAIWDPEAGELMTIWDGHPVRRPLLPGEGAMGQAFELGETVAVEDYPNWPHASPRTIELGCKRAISVPMLGPDGPIGVLGVRFFGDHRLTPADSQLVQLVTAQVTPSMAAARLHSDLARSALRLQGVYQAMASGVIVFDDQAKILEINDAALRIFGVERSDLNGRLPGDVAQLSRIPAPDGTQGPEWPYGQALRTGKPVHGSVIGYRRPDGTEFWVQFDAVPLLDAEGHVEQVISSFIDVTSVKSAELATRENEAKSRFLASMSHELRTPLNSILGFAQLLEQRSFGDLNDRQTRYVGHITSSGQHLLELVNDILDLSKVAAGQMDLNIENVPVESTVNEVLARLRPMADGRGLWVTSAVVPGLVARADRRRLEQVLFNLLSNAIKFTPAGGTISVKTGTGAGVAFVTVSDTGIGIPDEEKESLFHRFFRASTATDAAIAGTGLGLSIAKAIAEAHSGTISVDDAPGGGTVFRIELPLPAVSSAAAAA